MIEAGTADATDPQALYSSGLASDSLAIVLPTFEEVSTVAEVVERAVRALDPLCIRYELIVVDDGSKDGTADRVRTMLPDLPQLRLVQRSQKRGLSGAILDGWASTSASVIGVIDADLQHPPELLPDLWKAMADGAEIAVASRYALGATTGRWRWLRKTISSLAVLLCRPLQRRNLVVKDPMSGFFMTRRSVVKGLPPLQRSGFKLLLEILVRGNFRNVREVPFCFGLRQGGQSKAGISILNDYIGLLIHLYFSKLTRAESASRSHLPRDEQAAALRQ